LFLEINLFGSLKSCELDESDLVLLASRSLGSTTVVLWFAGLARDTTGVEIFRAFAQGMDPQERKAIYSAMARVLAAIHSIDGDAIGLSEYGRSENYCQRQVRGF